jgi:shikimate dehydrogenase
MKKACVIGWPIKHSRSPLIHNYWIKQHQIDAVYERHAVAPENLHSFIRGLEAKGFSGCNVTIPHKQAALACVDHFDARVSLTGSLNTIYLADGKINATSTDGEGFYNNVISVKHGFTVANKSVLMLGAGGSAKAICEKLLRENAAQIVIVNRTQSRVAEFQKIFGTKIKMATEAKLKEHMAETDLLINTTSQGMTGQPELKINLTSLPPHAIVADIVYVPLKTQLIKNAEALGLTTVPGLGMLLHQAVEGFHLWFAIRPQVTSVLYNMVEADILAEQNI